MNDQSTTSGARGAAQAIDGCGVKVVNPWDA
jgi:hypothetical protein